MFLQGRLLSFSIRLFINQKLLVFFSLFEATYVLFVSKYKHV